ncbi:MAG: ABC transporter ATP-binding protein [Chloroflexota bacterium]|nr:ABC transporter ATP-binding protein [Chloroflexota bacterium]
MQQGIIVADRVSKVYDSGDAGQVAALEGISLTIARGEFVAVTGPSGSGKSTLLNLIGAIDKPTLGRVVVNGQDISRLHGDKLADFRRETVGRIFQMFNLVPILSAAENVKLPLIPYPPKGFNLDTRATELLNQVGLSGRARHLPSQLSGGEQQRVAVARALINRPVILLADEPTGNLDSKAGEALMELFVRLHEQQGVTIVMVTHDQKMAGFAQRIVELRDGKLVN